MVVGMVDCVSRYRRRRGRVLRLQTEDPNLHDLGPAARQRAILNLWGRPIDRQPHGAGTRGYLCTDAEGPVSVTGSNSEAQPADHTGRPRRVDLCAEHKRYAT